MKKTSWKKRWKDGGIWGNWLQGLQRKCNKSCFVWVKMSEKNTSYGTVKCKNIEKSIDKCEKITI